MQSSVILITDTFVKQATCNHLPCLSDVHAMGRVRMPLILLLTLQLYELKYLVQSHLTAQAILLLVKDCFVWKSLTEKRFKEMTLLDFNVGYNWPCCQCCRLVTVLCVLSVWKCAWQFGPFLCYLWQPHLCGTHSIYSLCRQYQKLLITEVIICFGL